MRSNRLLWGSIASVTVLLTLLFISGFVYAVNDILFPKAAPFVQAPTEVNNKDEALAQNKINIVALGDSLTKGTGDLTGRGYVGKVKELLQTQLNKDVFIYANFAVNGYKSGQLLTDLSKNGEAGAIKQANVILLTIGGNDLFNAGNDEVNPDEIARRIPAANSNVEKILIKLHTLNPKADIIYVGLYNPFIDLESIRAKGSLVMQEWNSKVYETITQYPNMTLVPTFDLFEKHNSLYLSSDHFHPNQLGYERIAERIVRALQ